MTIVSASTTAILRQLCDGNLYFMPLALRMKLTNQIKMKLFLKLYFYHFIKFYNCDPTRLLAYQTLKSSPPSLALYGDIWQGQQGWCQWCCQLQQTLSNDWPLFWFLVLSWLKTKMIDKKDNKDKHNTAIHEKSS